MMVFNQYPKFILLRALFAAALLITPLFSTAQPVNAAPQEAGIAIEAGGFFTCGLVSDGTLRCWGENTNGQAVPPAGVFTQVSSGRYHACAVRQSDNGLECWGSNTYGEKMPPSGAFLMVSSGGYHTCGLRSDNTIQCWGSNTYGQSASPSGAFVQVSSGNFHTCAVRADGTLACWGRNNFGQIDAPAGTFTKLSAGIYHNCAIRDDSSVACWGDNGYGQATPAAGTFTHIGAGGAYTCGIRSDNTLACWGFNGNGRATPPPGAFIDFSAGVAHGCALRVDSVRSCWGLNDSGQAPRPTLTPATLPDAHLDMAYAQTVEGAGGTAPYTLGISSGALPAGLTFNPDNGLISGTPETQGVFPMVIEAVDSGAWPWLGWQNYTITVTLVLPTVTIVVHNAAESPVSSVVYNESVHLEAQVSGTAGEATGTVTFQVFDNANCENSPTDLGTIALSGGTAHPSTTFDPNAGAISFKALYSGDTAYDPASSACLPFVVDPRLLDISAEAVDREYNGTPDAALTVTDNRISGDVIDFIYDAVFADENVGVDKPVTIHSITLSGADAANYLLNSPPTASSASILPREITITADPKLKSPGLPDPPLTFQITEGSLVSGDTLSGSLERQPGETIGSYDIQIGTLTVDENYVITFIGADLMIMLQNFMPLVSRP